jgi:MerR family mercuric resistance operon transcriptional regulator
MTVPQTFPIGGLSSRSGVNVETIRYYERIGLLAKPLRTSSGYRLYRLGDVERLAFIRRARDLGFSVDEVRRLLSLADGRSRSCRRVRDIAATHLADIRTKLGDLHRMEQVLANLVDSCADGTLPACPLLETLAQASAEA